MKDLPEGSALLHCFETHQKYTETHVEIIECSDLIGVSEIFQRTQASIDEIITL